MIRLNGLTDFIITIFAPINKGRFMQTVAAKEWNNGNMQMKVSLLVTLIALEESKALEMRLWWVSNAPLGCPVVPEVYRITARSSGPVEILFTISVSVLLMVFKSRMPSFA